MHIRWQCPPSAWQAILDQIPSATFFHTPAWAAVYTHSRRGDYEVLHATWPDGRQALIPIGVRPIWQALLRAASGGIDGGYGGILATGPLDPDEQAALLQALHRRHPEWALTTNPFDCPPPEASPFQWQPAGVTHAIPLAPLEKLRQGYSKDRLRAAKRYEAEGVKIQVIDRPGDHDRRLFTTLYRQAAAHWHQTGRPTHWVRNDRWFQALWHCAAERLTMVVARVGDTAAGAEIIAGHGRIATELFAVWDRRFAKQQVATALAEASLAESYARGFHYLDGMPSGVLRGVDRHKASLGGIPRPIFLASHQHWLSRTLQWGKGMSQRYRHWMPLGAAILAVQG
jgi:hypothetical protein